ncbi:hypothetical protein MKX08_009064 [Trichoderma sp. CBMAI-0020]|nr:hypothetical protein MKX08_009064 [Trichoderma sp. CBMAI-0020]
MGNVLFQLSNVNETLTIDDPQVGKVSKKDGSPNEKGVPDYLVEPAEYGYGNGELLDEVQLVDFAFFVSNPPKSIHTPMSFQPPELVFRLPLTEAVDIWNLGCTTYELVIGRTPLEAFMDDRELIPQFQKVLSGLPEQWIREGLETGVLEEKPDASRAAHFLPLEEQIQKAYANGYDKETLDLNEKDLSAVLAEQPFKAHFGSQPSTFRIDIDPSFIEETRVKASLARVATDLAQHDPRDGPPVQNVTAIKDYWTHSFNWDDVQTHLNEHLPQFTTTIDGAGNYSHSIPLHFVHRQSFRKDTIPLLFVHGYPGLFLEVDRVIDGYTDPPSNETAFHVVAPSLPGFGFSPAPEYPGLGLREVGQIFHKLMLQLGYDKYIVHGGDLGSHTVRYMAINHLKSVRALHTNLWYQAPNKNDMERFNAEISTAEEAFLINVLATFRLTYLGQRQVFENQPLQ